MTSITDSPSGTDTSLVARRATEVAQALRLAAATWGLTPGEQAADILNLSLAGVLDAMAAGALDGVIIGGQPYVVAEQVHLRVLDEARHATVRATELRPTVRAALRAYLADREVRALWFEAMDEGCPLVCARRGKRFTHYGIEYHSVVITSTALAAWARDNAARLPEHASLPAGPVLDQALGELPGVTPVRSVTPLGNDVLPRKMSHAFRLDPRVWPLKVPALIADLVNNPPRDDEQ